MDESRFRTANVHHIYPRNPEGFECLCGAVMGTHRDCTEHIVDMYRAELRAKVEALPYVLTYGTAEVKRTDVLALLDGDDQ
jgi:hypothetical protein